MQKFGYGNILPERKNISPYKYLLSDHHLPETAFSKSHFSERPQENYEHVIILHSKSLKKSHKNFENRLTNKNFMQENIFE